MLNPRYYKRFILFTAVCIYCCNLFSQKTIPNLRAALDKATSLKDKADISFDIGDHYAYLLKLDSAIYFANLTKELSEKNKYETGVGKYHLLMGQVLTLRNRN